MQRVSMTVVVDDLHRSTAGLGERRVTTPVVVVKRGIASPAAMTSRRLLPRVVSPPLGCSTAVVAFGASAPTVATGM